MEYLIISTGSKGNAVLINRHILIDCGVAYKAIKPYVKGIELVLLTHIHSDHFKPETIRRLAAERPTVRFGCGKWLLPSLLACGVQKWRVDVYIPNNKNTYRGDLWLCMVPLIHNVDNCGYKLSDKGEKIFYATDTNSLDEITAADYDYYFIEANYEDNEIQERIRAKEENGEYAYEREVLKNHLSKAKADDFLIRNAGAKSQFVYMHTHAGIEFD